MAVADWDDVSPVANDETALLEPIEDGLGQAEEMTWAIDLHSSEAVPLLDHGPMVHLHAGYRGQPGGRGLPRGGQGRCHGRPDHR
ncbi:hypothetical protein ACFWY5_54800 [Nonomuraea sp. NPDC059007]|uniref:hypothetical protein n=1 Tax=Nonomuraea sp. NPDC059007 TaxID=3346692 RepID=UPI0036C9336E